MTTVHPSTVTGNILVDGRKDASVGPFGSFIAKMPFAAQCGWSPMNPSVCVHDGKLRTVVRTVNYIIDRCGKYVSTDGVTRTRNFLDGREIADRTGTKKYLAMFRGYEDMRLFSWRDKLWASATACDLTPYEDRRFVRLELSDAGDIVSVAVNESIEPNRQQKNWMPLVRGDDLFFVYTVFPTVVLRWNGDRPQVYSHHRPGLILDALRGGSQLIPFDGGWLCLTHEVACCGQDKYYTHRFVKFDDLLHVIAVSEAFYFRRRGIEFCAGLAPWSGKLLATFGVRDAEAWQASFSEDAVSHCLVAI